MKRFRIVTLMISACSFSLVVLAAQGEIPEEFRIKRASNFEFAQKPVVDRKGDRISISFETKSACDVTVAVEDAKGRIVRHLASGVLGPNAPAPLKKDSLKQTLVWDGKDDQGTYIDEKDSLTIRVSLGLKPRFEKSLFHSSYKRVSNSLPILAACEEGMLVYEGVGVDMIRLYDHGGRYLRTIYPFPANKLEEVKGLRWRTFPQDGKKLPVREGHVQATLLNSGDNAGFDGFGVTKHRTYLVDDVGRAGSAMAAQGKRIALVRHALNRLALDGTTGGLSLTGAKTCYMQRNRGRNHNGFGGYMPGGENVSVCPGSVALSPDGKWLYLTDYVWAEYMGSARMVHPYLHGVVRVPYQGEGEMTTFAGQMKRDGEGSKPGQFKQPVSVACDAKGRVYVADMGNGRVQVFSPDGKHLKSLAVPRPVHVALHPKSGELFVVTTDVKARKIQLKRYGPFERLDAKSSLTVPVPLAGRVYGGTHGMAAAVDVFADPPTLWLAVRPGKRDKDKNRGLRVFAEKDGKLKCIRDFEKEARKGVVRLNPPSLSRQRLVVNPKTGKLWMLEGDGAVAKSVLEPIVIDPENGKQRVVSLPHDAEDLAFDINGLAYLRGLRCVTRWNPRGWREVPWDYGEETVGVNHNNETGKKRRANVVAGLPVPVGRYNHQGGLWVSPKGNLAVGSYLGKVTEQSRKKPKTVSVEPEKYKPQIYPGRSAFGLVSIWNKHGKPVHIDALQGLSFTHGLAIDNDDNVYVMAVGARVIDGKPYWNHATDTLAKFPPKRGRILCTHKVAPVPLAERPDRDPDIVAPGGGRLGKAWVEGAEWFYGGVGYQGRHEKAPGYGCECWNARFTLDYFARVFAPEVDHYSVAILDSAGNLILRVGRYGNVDSAGPKSAVPLGGDEVGLFYAPYVATMSDRRLFIADAGNRRIVSVKLGYHNEARIALKDVQDGE